MGSAGAYRFFADENVLGVGRALAMLRRDVLHAAIMSAGLRGVWITDKKDLSNWDMMVRLVRQWVTPT